MAYSVSFEKHDSSCGRCGVNELAEVSKRCYWKFRSSATGSFEAVLLEVSKRCYWKFRSGATGSFEAVLLEVSKLCYWKFRSGATRIRTRDLSIINRTL